MPGAHLGGERREDRFQIRCRLGGGEHAELFLAWDARRGEEVVLKWPREPGPDPLELAERLAPLRPHLGKTWPGLLPLLDLVELEGRPTLVLPLCPGGSLADRQRLPTPLSPGEHAALAACFRDAQRSAQAAGLPWRAPPPEHVLLSQTGWQVSLHQLFPANVQVSRPHSRERPLAIPTQPGRGFRTWLDFALAASLLPFGLVTPPIGALQAWRGTPSDPT
jgi:serine/threonine protein kinase